jgi:hypothetical protein
MKRALPLFALLLAYRVAHADAQLASEARSVPEFRAIDLAGTLEVEVTIGKPASVVVSGEADLLAKVTTTVKGGTLIIDTKREDHTRRNTHLKVTITVPDLTAASLSGTGEVKVTGVANSRFAVDLSGTGSLAVTGSTDALSAKLSGTGEIKAKALTAKDATIALGGTGSASVYATESIEANVSGTGSVDVHGHPARVKKSVSGLGSVKIR